jgi:hypothetical protein
MNDREFSDIEIFRHSGKGIPLFMTGHKNCLQADYLSGPGSRLTQKERERERESRIYRAAVSQRLRDTALDRSLCLRTILLACQKVSLATHVGPPYSHAPAILPLLYAICLE